jgi:HlyD family secretion protein
MTPPESLALGSLSPLLRYIRRVPLVGVAGLVLVGALLVVALWPSAIPVDVATVERGMLRVTIEEEGQARVRDRVVISAPVAGRVLRPFPQPGERVVRGTTILATIAVDLPTPDQRATEASLAALMAAERTVERARADAARATAAAMVQGGLTALLEYFGYRPTVPETIEAQRRQERVTREQLKAADTALTRAEYEAARARVRAGLAADAAPGPGRRITIRASADGVVLKRYRDSEGLVAPGEPLLEIGDPTQVEIVSPVLSRDAIRIAPGAPAAVREWGGEPLAGRVARVDPAAFTVVSALGVTEQRVNVVTALDDPQQAVLLGLGDGFRVELQIVVWEQSGVVKAPTSSLFRRGDAWAVFVVEGARARVRSLKVGHISGIEAEILEGLQPGEHVVVHPSESLQDGARVAPADPSARYDARRTGAASGGTTGR